MAMASGMNDLMTKPITMSQLITILRDLSPDKQLACEEVVPFEDKKSNTGHSTNHYNAYYKTSMKMAESHRKSKPNPTLDAPVPSSDISLSLTLKVMIGMGQVCKTNYQNIIQSIHLGEEAL